MGVVRPQGLQVWAGSVITEPQESARVLDQPGKQFVLSLAPRGGSSQQVRCGEG